MQTWLAENLNILWDRDPVLAGRVRTHPALETLPALDLHSPDALETGDAWAEAQLALIRPDRLVVVFGLGPHAWALRARTGLPIWIVEPSLSRLVACMTRLPLLPLLLNGRLLVGESVEQAVGLLCRQRMLTLARHPGRYMAESHYFSEIDLRLRERADQAAATRQRNSLTRLREKAGVDTALGQLLEAMPGPEHVTVEAIDAFLGQTQRPWGKAERLLVAMNSFK